MAPTQNQIHNFDGVRNHGWVIPHGAGKGLFIGLGHDSYCTNTDKTLQCGMAIRSKIGVHVSIAGGIDKAPERAGEYGCEVFQCFTRSPQGGKAPALTADLITTFRNNLKTHSIQAFYIHTPYYINLASLNPALRDSSVRVIREELERGTLLGARAVMTHIGSYTGQTAQEGVAHTSASIQRIMDGYTGSTELLLEIAAGAGNVIGDTFEQIAEIMQKSGFEKPIGGFGGICFDTCHAFASGYDFRTADTLKHTLQQFDTYIGLDLLKLTHVNDSKSPLGDRKDRHEHIGEGHIGLQGIQHILTSEPFTKIDWLLETEESRRLTDIALLKEIRYKHQDKD